MIKSRARAHAARARAHTHTHTHTRTGWRDTHTHNEMDLKNINRKTDAFKHRIIGEDDETHRNQINNQHEGKTGSQETWGAKHTKQSTILTVAC